MTTREAAAAYLGEHLAQWDGRPLAIHNPRELELTELPAIYCFDNTPGEHDWHVCYAIAQDGTVLGQHVCSHELYMPHDLGAVAGARDDRHEDYRKHYPDGYRMEVIDSRQHPHAGLRAALELNRQKAPQSTPSQEHK